MKSHLELAHSYWRKIVQPQDLVIDATCGNGHDTLLLCQLASEGIVHAFDIQIAAINNTKALLQKSLTKSPEVIFHQSCHSHFPEEIKPRTVKLIVYNLGYLPGGNKQLTSLCSTTMSSFKAAQELVCQGGMISITCYPGHEEGQREEIELLRYCEQLPPHLWNCCYHRWPNRHLAPSLLLIQLAR